MTTESEECNKLLQKDEKKIVVPLIQIPTSKIRGWFSKLFGGGHDSN